MDVDYQTVFKNIEDNNLSHGIFFLTYLLGSRFVFRNVPKTIKSLFEYLIVRIFVIFSASFVATKNTKNALILASVYVILFEFIFNPKSVFCLIECNKSEKNKQEPIDIGINNQTVIQQQQPAPQQQQIQTQLPPLQMDMTMTSTQMNSGPMGFGVENFSNY